MKVENGCNRVKDNISLSLPCKLDTDMLMQALHFPVQSIWIPKKSHNILLSLFQSEQSLSNFC
jgi:hypothetical protein